MMDKTYQTGSLIPDLVIGKTVDDILVGRDTVVEALRQSY
jgi:hypothetical protein